MLLFEQIAAERSVVPGNVRPQVEAAIRALYVQHRAEDFQHGVKLLAIQRTVGAYMHFVVPCRNTGQLSLNRHRAAMVSAVKQETLEDVGIARDKT
ncbi:hypothetical protein D3C72_2312950 [compost metagenome]